MPRRHISGSAGPQRQFRSELDLLRDGERIVDLDPEIANGALQLVAGFYKFEPPSFGATNACRKPNDQDRRAPPIDERCGRTVASRDAAAAESGSETSIERGRQCSSLVRSDAKPAAALARPCVAHELCQTIHRGFGLTLDAIQTAVRFARNSGALVYAGYDAFCANSVTRRCLAEDLRRMETGSLSAGQLLDDLVGAGEQRVRQREAGRTSGL